MSYKITHLTSAHSRYDTRIFLKECSSLAKKYRVNLVVADGKRDEVKNGVAIYDVGKAKGRLNRIFQTTKKILKKAIALDSDIYHLHDPELMPIGLKLKKMGKKVIFDAHEDLPKQILSKPYLNNFLLQIVSVLVKYYEKSVCSKFDYIITSTPIIREKFLKVNLNSIDIKNFPIIEELNGNIKWSNRQDEVCYIGGITKDRGIREIVIALGYLDNIYLNLAGNFVEKDIEQEVKSYPEWNKVREYGFVNRDKIAKILSQSKVGLVTLLPIISYQEALPIKMFEYMSVGIPIIASNFPLWKEIVEEERCGICVNPKDAQEIANAIEYFITHPRKAEEMGENGQNAVLTKYNWFIEEQRLYKVYEDLLQ